MHVSLSIRPDEAKRMNGFDLRAWLGTNVSVTEAIKVLQIMQKYLDHLKTSSSSVTINCQKKNCE